VFSWNPIYPAIVAMAIGTIATVLCRPDLVRKTWIGGFLFLAYYIVFLLGLESIVPGYIARVWNLDALSGLTIGGMPLYDTQIRFSGTTAAPHLSPQSRMSFRDPQAGALARAVALTALCWQVWKLPETRPHLWILVAMIALSLGRGPSGH
jgi:hypothetical protein